MGAFFFIIEKTEVVQCTTTILILISGCNTRLGIAELSAQNDRNTCTITTAIHAEGEATRALIRENEIQALRDKVQALELGNAMCGVVRYPNQMAYTTNCNPFGGNGCCNNNI